MFFKREELETIGRDSFEGALVFPEEGWGHWLESWQGLGGGWVKGDSPGRE